MTRIAALTLPLLLLASPAGATPWSLPEVGQCKPADGLAAGPFAPAQTPGADVRGRGLETGQFFEFGVTETLRPYLPPEIWRFRERFFYDGMRLEIGPCFADYSPPGFFAEATDAGGETARLLPNGGLSGHTAGLPFAPSALAQTDPDLGMKWAWNAQYRYRAGGFRGQFRIEDLLGAHGRVEPFRGEIFVAQLTGRADRPQDGYRVSGDSGTRSWAAGGKFEAPFELRNFAWRQFRSSAAAEDPRRSDDLHLWIPALGKSRRIAAAEVEGLFLPSAKVGVTYRGKTSGPNEIEPKRSGFEGLELRPLWFQFEFLSLHDVITPINTQRAAYPEDEQRGFGPWGVSWASDRWDLRRALVLEAKRRETSNNGAHSRLRLWVDLQTLQPLYYVSYDSSGSLIDVGYFVGRWSEGRRDYPQWPDDSARQVRIIDSVGATFINVKLNSSWRRESWNVVSTPLPDSKLRREISLQTLERGR